MGSAKPKVRTLPGGTQATGGREPRRSKPWTIFIMLSIAGAMALVGFLPALFSGGYSASVSESVSESPTGTIAESEMELCKRLRFDDDGRVFQDIVPCDQSSAHDARGRPVPAGTIRRLDAISKSFSGR